MNDLTLLEDGRMIMRELENTTAIDTECAREKRKKTT